MSEQKSGGNAGGIGEQITDQFEQYRQKVMDSGAVRTIQERIQAQGPDLIERVKGLAGEAMVRRIAIQQDGRTLFEFPLAVGLGGALLAPQLAALGALAALVTNCTITVEREAPADDAGSSSGGGSSREPVGAASGSGSSGGGSGSSSGGSSSSSTGSGASGSSTSGSASGSSGGGSSTGGNGSSGSGSSGSGSSGSSGSTSGGSSSSGSHGSSSGLNPGGGSAGSSGTGR